MVEQRAEFIKYRMKGDEQAIPRRINSKIQDGWIVKHIIELRQGEYTVIYEREVSNESYWGNKKG